MPQPENARRTNARDNKDKKVLRHSNVSKSQCYLRCYMSCVMSGYNTAPLDSDWSADECCLYFRM